MRKVILTMSVSLDGFIEGPNREIDWHMVDDELHSHFNEWLAAMGAFLSGRVTYELMAEFWPTADADPSSTGPMVEFARIWRDMPKIVYSKTLQRADWNTSGSMFSQSSSDGASSCSRHQPPGSISGSPRPGPSATGSSSSATS